jgi:hypothetical protein
VFCDIFYSDHKRRVDVQPAPDPPHRLARALHYPPPLQRLDLGPGRLEYQLHLSLYPVRLQPLQRYHLVAAVHWGEVSGAGTGRVRRTVEAARDGLVAVALPDHEFDVGVLLRDAGHVLCDEAACVGRGRAVLAELEDDLADGGEECAVSVGGCRAQLGPQQCGRHGGR